MTNNAQNHFIKIKQHIQCDDRWMALQSANDNSKNVLTGSKRRQAAVMWTNKIFYYISLVCSANLPGQELRYYKLKATILII